MTEFTKTKMHFGLALLGTLFAMHPYLEKTERISFEYMNYPLRLFDAIALMAGLLAAAIYCYAVALLSERPASRIERVGNYCYAISVLVFPLYGVLYLSSRLEIWLGQSQLFADWLEKANLAWVGPALGLILLVFWLAISQVVAWRLRRRLSRQDRVAKVEELADQELTALNRAWEMHTGNHHDLAVIEAWKALESRLRRALVLHGVTERLDTADALVAAATRAAILREPALAQLHDVRKQWAIAVGTEPLAKEAAEKALQEVRDILSTIAVHANGPKQAA